MVNPMIPARQGIPIPELEYGQTSNVRVTFENSRGSWPGTTEWNCPRGEHCPPPSLLPMDPFGVQSRWIDVGAAGPRNVKFRIESDDWITVTPNSGKIMRDASTDMRLRLTVDWSKAPDSGAGEVRFFGSDSSNVTIAVPVNKYAKPDGGFKGFVEGDGYVAIEAAHFERNASADAYAFHEIKGYGRTLSGVEMFPMTTQNFTAGQGPSLEYDFWLHEGGNASLTLQMGPALNFLGVNKTLAFALQIDDDDSGIRVINPIPTEPLGLYQMSPEKVPLAIGAVPKDWVDIVKDEIRNCHIDAGKLARGKHTVKLFGMTTGLVFERLLVDMGGIKQRGYSYLGPPESTRV